MSIIKEGNTLTLTSDDGTAASLTMHRYVGDCDYPIGIYFGVEGADFSKEELVAMVSFLTDVLEEVSNE